MNILTLKDYGVTEVITRPGVDANTIRHAEQVLGFTFPEDYAQFIEYSNGGSLLIQTPAGRAELILDPLERVLSDTNRNFDEWYPECVVFGADGGGEAYVFDPRTTPISLVQAPWVGRMPDAIPTGNTLRELIYYIRHQVDDLKDEKNG